MEFTRNSFHQALLADVFSNGLNRADCMLLFALLHTHEINLASAAISDAPTVRRFAAITQHHCAECLAYLCRNMRKVPEERHDPAYWYFAWLAEWSYDRVDSLSGSELDRFREIKRRIEAHPVVDSLTIEDD